MEGALEEDAGAFNGGGGGADLPLLVAGTAPPVSLADMTNAAPSAEVVGSGDAGVTTFAIQRRVTIASDGKPHKVTVTIATLAPQTVHYVAPSVAVSAFIQAKTQNTTAYPLLSSKKVSVFIDDNFMSTSSLRQANPGEFFNVFLGVDPAVKVEYLPCHISSRVKGWIGGTEIKRYEYCTILHNTKKDAVRVIVADALPRSADERIVVDLLSPAPAALLKPSSQSSAVATTDQDVIGTLDQYGGGAGETPRAPGRMPQDFVSKNKITNSIVWLKTIPPGEKVELKLVYSISAPVNEPVLIK